MLADTPYRSPNIHVSSILAARGLVSRLVTRPSVGRISSLLNLHSVSLVLTCLSSASPRLSQLHLLRPLPPLLAGKPSSPPLRPLSSRSSLSSPARSVVSHPDRPPPDTILFSILLPGRSTLARRLPLLLPLPLPKLRVDLEVPRRKVLLPELALVLLEARVEVGGNDEREKGVDVKGGEGAFERELGGRNKGGSGGREKEVGRRKA